MKLFVCGFLALMAFACLVRVEAGFGDLFGGGKDDDDDKDDHKKKGGHYQGGIGKQLVHTLVDGGADRLADMAEERFDNPLIDAAIVGVSHKIKNKAHDEINEFGNDDEEEKEKRDDDDEDGSRRRKHHDDDDEDDDDERRNRRGNDDDDGESRRGRFDDDSDDEGGKKKKENFLSKLFRKKRNIQEGIKNAAIAGAKAAGKHVLQNAVGLGEKSGTTENKSTSGSVVSKMFEGAKNLVGGSDKNEDAKKEDAAEKPAASGGIVSKMVEGAKNLAGAGSDAKDEPKKEKSKKEEPKKEEKAE